MAEELLPRAWMSKTTEVILEGLREKRKNLIKRLNELRGQTEQNKFQEERDKRYKVILQGGSTKVLDKHCLSRLPLIVEDKRGSLVAEPEQVRQAYKDHFEGIYRRREAPVGHKPWMTCQRVLEVKSKIQQNPFNWNQRREMSLKEMEILLRKGKKTPSPGPDRMEKWIVRILPTWLKLKILTMLNYTLQNDCYPRGLQEVFIHPIYKRDNPCDLGNYRGIALSNYMRLMISQWISWHLQPYAARMILPETQIATRAGVSPRDLTSFLTNLHYLAKRRKQRVYAVCADHAKGFDLLSPQGVKDYVEAYDLGADFLQSLISGWSNRTAKVNTPYGHSDVLDFSGVIGQGSCESPAHYVCWDSMGSHWISELIQAVEISSSVIHFPEDKESLRIQSVSIMDDTWGLTNTPEDISQILRLRGEFITEYGGRYNMKKCLYTVIGHEDDKIHEIGELQDGERVLKVDIGGETMALRYKASAEIMNTMITGLEQPGFQKAIQQIRNFTLPRKYGLMPFAVMKRYVSQRLYSRVMYTLSMSPVSDTKARLLDMEIAKLAAKYFNWIKADSQISTRSVENMGMGIPSIEKSNKAMAIKAFHRDMNHWLRAFRKASNMTWNDLTCGNGQCEGRHQLRPSELVIPRNFPPLLQTVVAGLNDHQITLITDDWTHYMEGEVSIAHIIPSISKENWYPDLVANNLFTVNQLGGWGRLREFRIHLLLQEVFGRRLALINKVRELVGRCQNFDPSSVVPKRMNTPRNERQNILEEMITRAWEQALEIYPDNKRGNYASDGSKSPAGVGTAVVADRVIEIRHPRGTTIQEAELCGIATAILAAKADWKNGLISEATIWTDSMVGWKVCNEVRGIPMREGDITKPNRHWVGWISSILLSWPAGVSLEIRHIKAHQEIVTFEQRMNDRADWHAKAAARSVGGDFPVPTTHLERISLWAEDRVLTTDLYAWVMAGIQDDEVDYWLWRIADTTHIKVPRWIYDNSLKDFSVNTQFQLRSGNLPTQFRLTCSGDARNRGKAGWGCYACKDELLEIDTHLFIECRYYWKMKKTAVELLLGKIEQKVEQELGWRREDWIVEQERIGKIFLSKYEYYWGVYPEGIGDKFGELKDWVERSIHQAEVYLAGRIWGDLLRRKNEIERLVIWNRGRVYKR